MLNLLGGFSLAITRIGNPSVVVDISTRLTMIGFAGEDLPRFVFPTVVGYPSMDSSKDASEYYIGKDLFESMPPRLVYPIKSGLIEDWNAIEAIYTHVFNLLEVISSKSRVLVTENVFNPRENKERLTQMLFHDFGVSHLYHAQRSVLTMIGVQQETGIVIDFEPDYISIVPVYEEYSIPHALQLHDAPTTTGLDIQFIVQQIVVLLEKVDSNIHDTLCNNIVLTGSSTTPVNFETALLENLQESSPSGETFRVIAPPDRLYLPWRGGSIFGSR